MLTDGSKVATLFDGTIQPEMKYELIFDGTDLPAGVYVIKLTTDLGNIYHQKMFLHKD